MYFDPEVYAKQRILGLLGLLCLIAALVAPALVVADEPETPMLTAWNSQFGDHGQVSPNRASPYLLLPDAESLQWQ